MVKGWKVITIKEETYNRLKKYNERKKTKKKINPWIDEFLLMNLEKEDFLTQIYAPNLNNIGIHDNYVVLKDEKLGKFVEVRFQNENLVCSEDEGECCIHVHFVMAMPELAAFFQKHEFLKKTRPVKK